VVKRCHRMAFGAEPHAAGGVRFRLFAPAAAGVELCLEGAGAPAPMAPAGGGWHERLEPAAGAGSRYRFRIDGGLAVPDPASRFQPEGVHGPSEVIDPQAFDWPDAGWQGRDWREAVCYELHVGAFSAGGDYAGVEARLDHLAALGVTAIELMPLAAFPGARGWGYDGVALFAPHAGYGRPEALKRLIAAAHARGLMVLLDVVYNHFGPEGNYLHTCAPQFFNEQRQTPWGAAIDFDSPVVRAFFIANACYWLAEYGFDGLRLDAVHAILDDNEPHLLEELAAAVQAGPGRERQIHLVLENDANQASRLATTPAAPGRYRAQWNDDLHHVLHVLATGERDGYYADYAEQPVQRLGRCLAEGFAYQGEPSVHRGGVARGEPSAHLPPEAFVAFLQNHDQIGNRAFGERITALAPAEAVRAATAIVLLAPQVPLLFMGEETGTQQPFPFFCDFGPELAQAVTEGRRREFASFARFAEQAAREAIPDPNDPATFEAARLDWAQLAAEPAAQAWLAHYRGLLALRRRWLAEQPPPLPGTGAAFQVGEDDALRVQWRLAGGARRVLIAQLRPHPAPAAAVPVPAASPLYATPEGYGAALAAGRLPAWSAAWYLEPAGET